MKDGEREREREVEMEKLTTTGCLEVAMVENKSGGFYYKNGKQGGGRVIYMYVYIYWKKREIGKNKSGGHTNVICL